MYKSILLDMENFSNQIRTNAIKVHCHNLFVCAKCAKAIFILCSLSPFYSCLYLLMTFLILKKCPALLLWMERMLV